MTYVRLRPNARIELELIWTMLENAKMSANTYKRVVIELSKKAAERPCTPIMSVETRQMQDAENSLANMPSAVSELKNFVKSGNQLSRADLTEKINAIEKLSDELTLKMGSIHVPKTAHHEIESTEFMISLQQAAMILSNPQITSGQAAPRASTKTDVLSDAWNVMDKNVNYMELWNRILASKDGTIDQVTRTRFLQYLKKLTTGRGSCQYDLAASRHGAQIRKRRRRN